ncbi:uncharacterized protein BP5553_03814 [Venustampulla echinocandica]|uniref:Uncharacterized protein n=1 Tax=Venustampulla echinocandica TaxID=2656787 RepID=A0A370TVB2_9HELO|nr:uncharacterized protein BP5553_03814 [Venustampulla echinocandica]RDL39474.1 hypothetical protein BP5553_03814 [Venustampulla echinocandica]
MLLSILDAMPANVANNESIYSPKDTLIENSEDYPMKSDFLRPRPVFYKVESQVDEGKSHSIVAPRLGREEISQMFGDPFGKLAFSNDGTGQDRVRCGNAGRTAEALEPIERRYHPPDEQTGHQPSERHDGKQQKHHTPPMLLHIIFGQFDPHGKALDDQDDARELERDLIGITPCSRVDQIGGVRAKDDATDGGDGGFTYVQPLLDERRAQHEKRREAAKDDVDQVRPIDRQVVPCHLERCGCRGYRAMGVWEFLHAVLAEAINFFSPGFSRRRCISPLQLPKECLGLGTFYGPARFQREARKIGRRVETLAVMSKALHGDAAAIDKRRGREGVAVVKAIDSSGLLGWTGSTDNLWLDRTVPRSREA